MNHSLQTDFFRPADLSAWYASFLIFYLQTTEYQKVSFKKSSSSDIRFLKNAQQLFFSPQKCLTAKRRHSHVTTMYPHKGLIKFISRVFCGHECQFEDINLTCKNLIWPNSTKNIAFIEIKWWNKCTQKDKSRFSCEFSIFLDKEEVPSGVDSKRSEDSLIIVLDLALMNVHRERWLRFLFMKVGGNCVAGVASVCCLM